KDRVDALALQGFGDQVPAGNNASVAALALERVLRGRRALAVRCLRRRLEHECLLSTNVRDRSRLFASGAPPALFWRQAGRAWALPSVSASPASRLHQPSRSDSHTRCAWVSGLRWPSAPPGC